MVEEESLPGEKKYLLSPERAHGRKKILNLRPIYPADLVQKWENISKESGLWYFLIPEEWGGMGLSLLAQVVAWEQFNYTYVPFPFANVPSILYMCQGDQVDKFLKPVLQGTNAT